MSNLSSWVVRASDCQCRSHNSPGFNPSILRHSGIWGAANETVLDKVGYIKNPSLGFYVKRSVPTRLKRRYRVPTMTSDKTDPIAWLLPCCSRLMKGEGSENTYDLINEKKQKKKGSKYTNSGTLRLHAFRMERIPTFLDFIRGGLQVSLQWIRVQKWNFWTAFVVEISGYKLFCLVLYPHFRLYKMLFMKRPKFSCFEDFL